MSNIPLLVKKMGQFPDNIVATTIPGPSIINDPEKLTEFVNNLEDDTENFKTAVN